MSCSGSSASSRRGRSSTSTPSRSGFGVSWRMRLPMSSDRPRPSSSARRVPQSSCRSCRRRCVVPSSRVVCGRISLRGGSSTTPTSFRLTGQWTPPPIEESPVSITLNCAPPPEESQACVCPEDGSPASMPPTWTPDYVTAILDALTAEGLWPSGVVPLVVEYRCVCPALLAYSETLDSMEGAKAKAPPFAFADGCGLGCGGTNCRRRAVGTDEADDDGRTRHGFLCGSYPESATTPSQRERQLRWFGLRSSLVRVPAHHRGGALTL